MHIMEKSTEEWQLPEGIVVPPPPHVYGVGAYGDPRLIITHIVNCNFKSYSGRQVLGPFHKSFTAIVGPNGSGKSNIIDSMLFVFGYRANKIRSKKLSVLIHDSENAPKVNCCSVEVHFEKIVDLEDGGYCNIPDSSFSISRKAFQDSSSQYFINERKSSFKDVASMLEENGIDLNHNRFLILQGEVEQIALMKPKAVNEHGSGMLEFLEDIIGSSRYKEAIEKLSKEIDFLDDERKDKLTRVKVIEKDKEQLEPLRNEAVNYLQKKNQRTKLHNMLLQYYVYNFTLAGQANREKLEEAKKCLSEMEESLKASAVQRKAKAKECKQVAQLLEKCHTFHTEKKDKMRELEKVNVQVFEDRKFKKNKIKELNKKLELENTKLHQLKLDIDKYENNLERSNQTRIKATERKQDLESDLKDVMQSLTSETKQLQEQKENLENLMLNEVKDVNEAKQQLDVAKVELELLLTQFSTSKEALNQCKTQIKECMTNEKEAGIKLSAVTSRSAELEQSKISLSEDLTKLRATEKKLEIRSKEGLATLADATVSTQMRRSNESVFKFLEQLKKSGKITGLYGRLGDLGVIDDKYDVAISSCCPALENILVDSIETAQACVQALKKNEIGHATFIALDKMQKHRESLQRNDRVSLPKLVHLVKPKEEKYQVAFYHALGDTLVAEDLASATKAAFDDKRRWRVVTLQGEVIDTSGTMSGGGNKVSKGRMGSKQKGQEISAEDITQLKVQSEEIEKELTETRSKIQHVEGELAENDKEFGKCKSQMKLLQQEGRSQKALLTRLQERLPELKTALQEAQPDPSSLKKLEGRVSELDKTYQDVVKKTTDLEEKKKKICEEISKIHENRLKPVKDSFEKEKKNLEKISKSITKLKVTLTSSKRALTKCEKDLVAMKSDIEENTSEIKTLEQKWKDLETEAASVLEEIATAEEEEKKCNENMQKLQHEYKELEELDKDDIEKQKKLSQTYERYVAEETANMEKSKQWKDELLKLKLHEIEGEEEEPLCTFSTEKLEETSEQEVKGRITILDSEIDDMQPNLNAIGEYKEKETIYLERVSQLDEVTVKREHYRRMLDHLRKSRLNEFSEGFSIITNKLKEIYQMITLGGDAELEFVDSLDPFSEGIAFSVRPPKKSWKNICNLSGGEKTLSSLALVFSLHHYRPTPLYVMDEIDAALDFKNVTIIAHYIVQRTKNAQFIIVSLRNNMFEVADRLVGIYKTDNCTKSATIEPSLIAIAK